MAVKNNSNGQQTWQWNWKKKSNKIQINMNSLRNSLESLQKIHVRLCIYLGQSTKSLLALI